MAPSARPSASTVAKKATSGGDGATVVVVVVVVVVVSLAGLIAVWFRFYGKKRPVDSGRRKEEGKAGEGSIPEVVHGPGTVIRYNDGKDDSQLLF